MSLEDILREGAEDDGLRLDTCETCGQEFKILDQNDAGVWKCFACLRREEEYADWEEDRYDD